MSNGIGGIEIIDNKYLPEGFVLTRDSEGLVIVSLADGKQVRLPHFTFEVKLPREYKTEGDKITGFLTGILRFDP